jgi:hypothetical protein
LIGDNFKIVPRNKIEPPPSNGRPKLYVPPKRQQISKMLHGVWSQKNFVALLERTQVCAERTFGAHISTTAAVCQGCESSAECGTSHLQHSFSSVQEG